MKSLLLTLFVFIQVSLLYSQQLSFGQGSAKIGAETGTANQDAFSIFNNPATMDQKQIKVGVSAKRYYLIDGLNEFNLSGSLPSKFGTIGAGLQYFGDQLYNEKIATIGLSRQLSEKISAGASLLYVNNTAQYAESASTFLPQLGISAELSDEFRLGAMMRNPFSQDLKEPFNQNIQAFVSFGGHYQPNEEITTTLQADLLESNGMSGGLAFKYKPLEKFAFTLGGRLNPGYITAGVTLSLSKAKVDIGSQYQQNLGFSPTFTAQTEF